MVMADSDYALCPDSRSGKFCLSRSGGAALCFIVVFVRLSRHDGHTLFSIERASCRMDTRASFKLSNGRNRCGNSDVLRKLVPSNNVAHNHKYMYHRSIYSSYTN